MASIEKVSKVKNNEYEIFLHCKEENVSMLRRELATSRYITGIEKTGFPYANIVVIINTSSEQEARNTIISELQRINLLGESNEMTRNIIKETFRNISITEKATGRGMGQGNSRQGTGGTDTCYCPSCDESFPHQRGVPCNEQECPECGNIMTGLSPEQINEADKDEEFKVICPDCEKEMKSPKGSNVPGEGTKCPKCGSKMVKECDYEKE